MKTVLVLGSNSFFGSYFVDLLLGETDWRVIGTSRSVEKPALFLQYKLRPDLSRFTFRRIDLNADMRVLKELLAREKPSAVVNFAAQSEASASWTNPEQWLRTNALAVAELGSFLKDQPWLERYVHISTPEVYGAREGAVREDAPVDPGTPYAASKAAGDLFLAALVKKFKFPLITIRATNVYGPRQQLFKLIPRAAICLKLARKIELPGGGPSVKSYLHVRDASRGVLAALEKGRPGQTYHFSADAGVAERDVVARLCRLMGRDFAASTVAAAERPDPDEACAIDSSKARSELDWRPRIGLDEGLKQVVDWVERHWKEIWKQPLEYQHKP